MTVVVQRTQRRSIASGSRERPGRRVRLGNDARRAQLLALGINAFSERTYDEVSVDDLARTAGISKGLLYHYFPTKRDLYVAGLRETASELLAKTVAAAALDLPPLERIRAGLDAYLTFVAARARPFAALLRGGIGSDPEVAAVIEGIRSAYVERLLIGDDRTPLTVIVASTAPMVRIAVRGWVGFVEAASLEWLARDQPSRHAVRDLLVDSLLATIRVVVAPSSSGGG